MDTKTPNAAENAKAPAPQTEGLVLYRDSDTNETITLIDDRGIGPVNGAPAQTTGDPVKDRISSLDTQIRNDMSTLIFWLLQGENITNTDRAKYFEMYMPRLKQSAGAGWHPMFDAMESYAKSAVTDKWDFNSFRDHAQGRGIELSDLPLPDDFAKTALDFTALVQFQESITAKIAINRAIFSSTLKAKRLCGLDTETAPALAWQKITAIHAEFDRYDAGILSAHAGGVVRTYDTPKAYDQNVQMAYDYFLGSDDAQNALALHNDFQQATGGLKRGSLVVISGHTGRGKTWLALKWFHDLTTKGGYKGLYLSCEMPIDQLRPRLAAIAAGDGASDPFALDRAAGRQFFGFDFSDSAIMESIIATRVTEHIDFVIVDYIQRVTPADPKPWQKNYDFLRSFAGRLKDMAHSNNMVVIAVAQRQSAVTGGPKNDIDEAMTDMSGSTHMINDADLGITIQGFTAKDMERDGDFVPTDYERENNRVQCAWIVKNRHKEQYGQLLRIGFDRRVVSIKGHDAEISYPTYEATQLIRKQRG